MGDTGETDETGDQACVSLLTAFEGARSIQSGSSTEEEVVEEAKKIWGRGPTGPGVQGSMFYL